MYSPLSTHHPRMFLVAPLPLLTDGIITATLSPTVESFIPTRLRFITRSARSCCASTANFRLTVVDVSVVVDSVGDSAGTVDLTMTVGSAVSLSRCAGSLHVCLLV